MRRSLAFAVTAMRGRVLPGRDATGDFSGAAADSREVTTGALFFALPGERVDGHDFAGQAAERGAAAAVVASGRGRPGGCERIPVIEVDDPRRALGDLARAVRAQFSGTVVAVAGSNGKTTTKELCAAALAPLGAVCKTAGNRNTDVGVPLTILGAAGDERVWVLEMAMRGLGEIAYLADVARPHVGLVTNTGPEHMERMKTLDNVARANGEVFAGLEAGGAAVVPAGDERLLRIATAVPASRRLRVVRFGPGSGSDVRVIEAVPAGPSGQVVRLDVRRTPVVVELPLPGAHNAENAAAALAVATTLGVPPQAAATALARVQLPPHRSAVIALGGRFVLDDCYNANPASMAAALAVVAGSASLPARAYAIVGDMLEVGDDAPGAHDALGALIASRGLAGVAALGEYAQAICAAARRAGLGADRALAAATPAEAAAAVAGWSRPGDWILVKASRGVRLERAIDDLQRILTA